jgi:hypothetical protein
VYGESKSIGYVLLHTNSNTARETEITEVYNTTWRECGAPRSAIKREGQFKIVKVMTIVTGMHEGQCFDFEGAKDRHLGEKSKV